MKRFLLAVLFWVIGASFAFAQTALAVRPYATTISNSSLTVTSTNVFQSIWNASIAPIGRTDCIIQNNGAANMYVYFGPIANALTTNSLTLASGSIFRCANSVVIIHDQISITGTSGQNFFAIQF